MKSALTVAMFLLLFSCRQEPAEADRSPLQPASNSPTAGMATASQAAPATETVREPISSDDSWTETPTIIARNGISYSVRVEASRGIDLPSLTAATAHELAKEDHIAVTNQFVASDIRTGLPIGTIAWDVTQRESGDPQGDTSAAGAGATATHQGRTYIQLAEEGKTVIYINCIGTPGAVAECDNLVSDIDPYTR